MSQPTADLGSLKARADLYQQIRLFFAERNVLEVETPVLAPASVTDPYIESFQVEGVGFLQTSPEYYMKRLLAAGSGDIYQLFRAFRKEEQGKLHNAEFALLEWYRVGMDQWDLMDEVADLFERLLGFNHFEHKSYRDAFVDVLGIDPHQADIKTLAFEARQHINIEMPKASKDDWLNLMMSHLIEPELGRKAPTFIYDYPVSQASLAKVNRDESGTEVAARFELYFKGVELANGFHELTDATIQKARFHEDNQQRVKMGLKPMPIDYGLIEALHAGLPDCAGVALGLDRLLMLKLNHHSLDQVIPFRFT